MSGDLMVPNGGIATVPGVAVENSFEIAFRPARPALDAIAEVQEALMWLDRRHQSRALFDRSEILAVVLADDVLQRAKQLFREAEHEPAALEAEWVSIVFALMVDSVPGARHVSDAYRHGILDSIFDDIETREGYRAGFSVPVVARSIREARRLDTLPTPGVFLGMCSRHRQLFRRWRADMTTLANLRFDAIHGECPF
jgi:hypothetical protein